MRGPKDEEQGGPPDKASERIRQFEQERGWEEPDAGDAPKDEAPDDETDSDQPQES